MSRPPGYSDGERVPIREEYARVVLHARCGFAASACRDDRQRDVGRTVAVAVHRVSGDNRVGVLADRLAGVRVEVEAREVTARDVEPNPVPGREQVARRRQRISIW